MDPFAMALDALFSAPGSVAAVYTPAGGMPQAIRVIRDQPSGEMVMGNQQIVVDTHLLLIRRSEISRPAGPERVQIGDFASVPVDAPTFTVAGEPRLDVEGLTWSCELLPAD